MDLRVLVEKKMSATLDLVQSKGIGFTDAEAVFHLHRWGGWMTAATRLRVTISATTTAPAPAARAQAWCTSFQKTCMFHQGG